jgi:hypothetical protein
MDMDSSSSWLHGYATTNGFMCGGYAASPAEVQCVEDEQQQFLISSQIQHHLNQASTVPIDRRPIEPWKRISHTTNFRAQK